jgi:aminoacylase
MSASANEEEHPSVALFREYLRIRTVQPKPDYAASTAFLRRQAEAIGLPFRVVEMVQGKPACIMTWTGREPDLPAILLNSHTDVVPVFPESWKFDPFEAVKDDNGDIYGRGTQVMYMDPIIARCSSQSRCVKMAERTQT